MIKQFPCKFEIDIRNKEELAILWACFNISNDNVIASLTTGYSKIIEDVKKKLEDRESCTRSFYLNYKTCIWRRLENMVNELEDNYMPSNDDNNS